jgi:hypothetical protein
MVLQLFVVRGVPLKPGQSSIRISAVLNEGSGPVVEKASAEGEAPLETGVPLQLLGDLVVTPETTVAEIKRMIAETFSPVTGESRFEADRIRLREVTSHKVGGGATIQKLGKVGERTLGCRTIPSIHPFGLGVD